jgi:hypothetical protein
MSLDVRYTSYLRDIPTIKLQSEEYKATVHADPFIELSPIQPTQRDGHEKVYKILSFGLVSFPPEAPIRNRDPIDGSLRMWGWAYTGRSHRRNRR